MRGVAVLFFVLIRGMQVKMHKEKEARKANGRLTEATICKQGNRSSITDQQVQRYEHPYNNTDKESGGGTSRLDSGCTRVGMVDFKPLKVLIPSLGHNTVCPIRPPLVPPRHIPR